MNWADEVNSLLNVARSVSAEELPRLLGDLENIRMVARQRLNAPAPIRQSVDDELINVKEAARRLGVSRQYLYTNQSRLPFTRHIGRRLLFSISGIVTYIRRNGARDVLTPRSIRPIVPPETLHNISDRKENSNGGEERRQ